MLRAIAVFVLASISAMAQVTVAITPQTTTGLPTVKVNFVGTATSSTGAKIASWKWTFGDGIFCNSPNFCGLTVTHNYPNLGTYSVNLSATDANGVTGSAVASVNVVKTLPPACSVLTDTVYKLPSWITDLTWTSPADVVYGGTLTAQTQQPDYGWLALAQVGQVYCRTLSAGGGTPPYTFSGNLPPGMTVTRIDDTTGLLSGTPTTAGSFSIQLTVVDSKGIRVNLSRNLVVCTPNAECTLSTVMDTYGMYLIAIDRIKDNSAHGKVYQH